MLTRKEKLIKLITDNPTKSANYLYRVSVKQGFSIAKSEHFRTVRVIRRLPEPSLQVKRKATPIKYRKPGVVVLKPPIIKPPITKPIPPELKRIGITKKPKSEYHILEIVYQKTKESRWIKYRDKKHLKEQLKTMEGSPIEGRYAFVYHGVRGYKWKETEVYKKLLEEFKKMNQQI